MDDATGHLGPPAGHHFGDGSGPGRSGGGDGPAAGRPGCLFGGWRMGVFDDDVARNRPPVPSVAALGLLLVVVVVLVYWFIAR